MRYTGIKELLCTVRCIPSRRDHRLILCVTIYYKLLARDIESYKVLVR